MTQARSFFFQFHRDRLDELRLRLDTEMWQVPRYPPRYPRGIGQTVCASPQALPLARGWKVSALKELRAGRDAPPLRCQRLFDAAATSADSGPNIAEEFADGPGAPFHNLYQTAADFFAAMDAGALDHLGENLGDASNLADVTDGVTADGERVTLCSTALNVARC